MNDQVTLTLWRDHDEDAILLPAFCLGDRQVSTGDPAAVAAALYREGVRRVALHGTIDLRPRAGDWSGEQPTDRSGELSTDGSGEGSTGQERDRPGGPAARATVDRLLLLAQLTSWALVVDWEIRLGTDPDSWRLLNHLYPPSAVVDHPGAGQIRDRWREGFYLCKCVWRQGPGFVEVRDRRAGSLSRFVIDEPDYLTAIERLSSGCLAEEIPTAVLDDVEGEGLAGRVGDVVWWLPYRVRRWPSAALVV